jgi:general secretion pathway protein D
VQLGSGRFVEETTKRQIEVDSSGDGVTLNFVDVEVQEFVRVVYDEVLHEPVVVDPTLKGRITVRTPGPVSKGAARDLVRQALQTNGAAVIRSEGGNRVSISKGDQKGGRRFGDTLRIVPLRYIGVEEAKAALSSLGQTGVDVVAGNSGQYLTIAGNASDLDNIEELLGALDVDQLKGMSFGLFPLKEAGSVAVSTELNQMFNREGDVRGFKALPIGRMNAVLIVSPKPHLLAASRKWLGQLDRADRDEKKIYVYPVQNRRAPEIAKLLSTVLQADKGSQVESGSDTVAPALTPVQSASRSRDFPSPQPTATGPAASSEVPNIRQTDKAKGLRISADTSTNSIVVTATAAEWRVIETALRRLDVMAAQVLIEATIAEVRLNDTLKQGVRWYFEKGLHGIGVTDDPTGFVGPSYPGFNYTFGIPQARVVLSALSQVTEVEIISSPALTVLDNQTAKLQVGDQVPIATRSSRSNVSPDAPTVNDIELKDTGVILSVTPRVNASGLVLLDITQEVSDVVPTTTSNLNSPTIRQRRVNSSVAVTSGKEIVLGGLIGASRVRDSSGVPGLMGIPVVGDLFKAQNNRDGGRTELIVILRPTVMANNLDIQNVTQEIKQRMSGLRRRAPAY